MKKPRRTNPNSQAERIWTMRETGATTAQISEHFNMEVFEVNSILARVRKRKRRDVAAADVRSA